MVTDFIITVLAYLAETLIYASQLEEGQDSWLTPPDWFMSLGAPAAKIFHWAASMGVWWPWDFVLSVILAVLASLLAGFGIRLVRMLISQFTGGGGNA